LADRAPIASVERPLIGYRVAGQNRSNEVDLMRTMHDAVLRKHRGALDADDARHGDLIYAQHLARFPLRQGRRVDAARAYLDIAIDGRAGGARAHGGRRRSVERRHARLPRWTRG